MNKIKILHTADVHLGMTESFLGTEAATRRFETLITFEKILKLAVAERADVLAIAGDLLDSNGIEPHFTATVFEKIAEAAPLRVIFAAGNHDPLNSESPFLNNKLPENLYVLGKDDCCIAFDDIRLRVWGRSFESNRLKGEETFGLTPPEDAYVNLMIQHGELKSDLNSDYNSITPKFVKNSKMDYIALGHIHKRSELGRIDNTFFAYCGCPEGQGFDETDEKGVYIGEIGKGFCDLKFVPVSKRRHICTKVDISECDGNSSAADLILQRLRETYGESYGENLYKIELTGNIDSEMNIIPEEIKSRIADRLYFVKLKDCTEYGDSLEQLAEGISLKGIFVKKMLEKQAAAPEEEKQLYHKALRLGLKAFTGDVRYSED